MKQPYQTDADGPNVHRGETVLCLAIGQQNQAQNLIGSVPRFWRDLAWGLMRTCIFSNYVVGLAGSNDMFLRLKTSNV